MKRALCILGLCVGFGACSGAGGDKVDAVEDTGVVSDVGDSAIDTSPFVPDTACTPKTTNCDGSNVVTCGDDGVFHTTLACPPGTVCITGRCDDERCPDETAAPKEFALPNNAWPKYRHDNRNSGFTRAAIADSPKLQWKVFVGGGYRDAGLASGAVINQDNRVFIGAGDKDGKGGSFYAYDALGKLVYTYPAKRGWGLSTPAVRQDGTAYFAAQDSFLYAVKPDGTTLWTYKTGANADSDPIVTREGTLIYTSDDGLVYALNPDGTLRWKSDLATGPGEVDGGVAQACDGRVVVGGRNGWYAHAVADGAVVWKVAGDAVSSTPLLAADGTMYGLDSGSKAWAIDAAGKVLWSKAVGSGSISTGMARIGSMVFVVTLDGKLHALDAKTGAELWARDAGNAAVGTGEQVAAPVVDGNLRIYFSGTDGFVRAWDTTGKELWKIAASGVASAVSWAGNLAIGADGSLYVPGNDGYLYVFR